MDAPSNQHPDGERSAFEMGRTDQHLIGRPAQLQARREVRKGDGSVVTTARPDVDGSNRQTAQPVAVYAPDRTHCASSRDSFSREAEHRDSAWYATCYLPADQLGDPKLAAEAVIAPSGVSFSWFLRLCFFSNLNWGEPGSGRPGWAASNDIQERLWGPGTFVDFEQGLNHCVRQIRIALGDDAINPHYVQTLPRRGYRFLPAPQVPEAREGPEIVERPVLAVLPFENLSGDCHEDRLGDGLTDELITQLGRTYPAVLGVVSRCSIRRYRNSSKPVVEMGRELGADYIVEGSVRRSVDRVRICAQLVDAEHQTHLWAEPYERTLGDVLSVQCEVAQAIAHEILLVLRLNAQRVERSDWIAQA